MIMTKKKEQDAKTKTPKLLRFTENTVERLRVAAAKAGMSEAVYTEQALKAQFKKDRIT
jgi:hypothetical protein